MTHALSFCSSLCKIISQVVLYCLSCSDFSNITNYNLAAQPHWTLPKCPRYLSLFNSWPAVDHSLLFKIFLVPLTVVLSWFLLWTFFIRSYKKLCLLGFQLIDLYPMPVFVLFFIRLVIRNFFVSAHFLNFKSVLSVSKIIK